MVSPSEANTSLPTDSSSPNRFAVREEIPGTDDRLVVVVVLEAEHARARRAAEEKPAGIRRQPEPAGRDHANNVPAGECQNVALDVTNLGDEPIGPNGNVARRFAAGAAVAIQFPTGLFLKYLPRQLPFELAVVPLDQVGID